MKQALSEVMSKGWGGDLAQMHHNQFSRKPHCLPISIEKNNSMTLTRCYHGVANICF